MNEKLDMQSPNWANLNSQFIAERFPNCVTESADGIRIDFDLLKQELSNDLIEGTKERYRLEWPGKKEAIVTANLPTTKTLRPIREDSVDFDNTENIYIEGDNLEVLKLLQESYLGKIKMIYIDPPYNTGKDFVYRDNFSKDVQDELLESGQKDEYNQRLVVNPESAGRYHSDWLTMMYPRLKLARNLLKDDGVIFISIDNNEVSNLITISNEIFGENSFVTVLHVEMSTVQGQKVKAAKEGNIVKNAEYILVYSKNGNKNIGKNILYKPQEYDTHYSIYLEKIEDNRFKEKPLSEAIISNDKLFNRLLLLGFATNNNGNRAITNNNISKAYSFVDELKDFIHSNAEFIVADDKTTGINLPNNINLKNGESLLWNSNDRSYLLSINSNGNIRQRLLLKEKIQNANDFNKTFGITTIRGDWWGEYYRDMGNVSKEGDMKYENGKKPIRLISDLIHISCNSNDIILDFFAGSGSTGHAIMDYNSKNNQILPLKFILVQIPELIALDNEHYKNGFKKISDIGKERLRRAAKKIKEETNANIDYGFRTYRLDESNMQDVYYKPQDYKQASLELFSDNVKTDRSSDDLLAQVMLDWGLPLSLKIEQVEISGKQVFKVAENSLYACFDKNIDEEFAKELAASKPLRVVFRDAGFKDDTAKTNVKQLLKQLSPETEMKVI